MFGCLFLVQGVYIYMDEKRQKEFSSEYHQYTVLLYFGKSLDHTMKNIWFTMGHKTSVPKLRHEPKNIKHKQKYSKQIKIKIKLQINLNSRLGEEMGLGPWCYPHLLQPSDFLLSTK